MEYIVYAINPLMWEGATTRFIMSLSDEEFMEVSEEQGLVYTLKGFEWDFNHENISDMWYIRIIKTDK